MLNVNRLLALLYRKAWSAESEAACFAMLQCIRYVRRACGFSVINDPFSTADACDAAVLWPIFHQEAKPLMPEEIDEINQLCVALGLDLQSRWHTAASY